MRILIAEDDPASSRILERALQRLGHEVTAAADGEAAWQRSEEGDHPVLVSDWMMPALDGVALTRRIRAAEGRRYTYVILLTTLGGRVNYLEAMEAGADDFLTKPFDLDELRARLRVAERIIGLQAQVKQLSEALRATCPECMQTKVEPELARLKALRGDER